MARTLGTTCVLVLWSTCVAANEPASPNVGPRHVMPNVRTSLPDVRTQMQMAGTSAGHAADHRGARRRAANLRRDMTAEELADLQARQVEDERRAREGCEPATLQHVLGGRCGGMEPAENRAHLEELRRQLDQLRRGGRGGGLRLLHAAAMAYRQHSRVSNRSPAL